MANKIDIGEDCGCIGPECKEPSKSVHGSLTAKEKITKIYFCPKCKSEQVGYVFRFANAFGVIPKMECRKCKYSATVFPQWVIGDRKLKELNKKVASKRK